MCVAGANAQAGYRRPAGSAGVIRCGREGVQRSDRTEAGRVEGGQQLAFRLADVLRCVPQQAAIWHLRPCPNQEEVVRHLRLTEIKRAEKSRSRHWQLAAAA